MHIGHSGHITRHRSAGYIVGAIGAKGPTQFEQALAFEAGAFELLAAGWANLEVALDARVTVIAGLAFGHLGQQRLFFQLSLIDFGHRLAWTQDHVDEKTTDKEDSHKQSGQNLRQEILGARMDIAPCPDHKADPKNYQEGDNITNNQTQQVIKGL